MDYMITFWLQLFLLPSIGDEGLDVELVTFGWKSGSQIGELAP